MLRIIYLIGYNFEHLYYFYPPPLVAFIKQIAVMKKQYMAPKTLVVNLHAEDAMLAASRSVDINNSSEVGAGSTLSNEQGWNQPIWGTMGEDD